MGRFIPFIVLLLAGNTLVATAQIETAVDDNFSRAITRGTIHVTGFDDAPEVTVTAPNGGEEFLTGDAVTVEWTAVDDGEIDSSVVEYSTNGGGRWTAIGVTHSDTFELEWEIPDMFDWFVLIRVTCVDDAGESGSDRSDNFFNISPTYATHLFFPGWTLMSIPLYPPDNDPDVIIGDDMEDFSDILEYHPVDGFIRSDELVVGKGYWLMIEPEAVYIDVSGDAGLDTFRTVLDQGWNLIGEPFPESISINYYLFRRDGVTYTKTEAVMEGLIMPMMYGYKVHEGYFEATWIAPWRGSWFLALEPDIEMLIFPPEPRMRPVPDDLDEAIPQEWLLQFVAVQGDEEDGITAIGADEEATDGFDLDFDFPEPPSPPQGSAITAFFTNDEWPELVGEEFNRDVRAVMDDEEKDWTLYIRTSRPGDVTLSWPDIFSSIPENYEFSLLDPAADAEVNLLEEEEYTFRAGDEQYNVIIRVTAAPLTAGEKKAQIPVHYSVINAFPTPFNASLNIEYQLSDALEVTLSVFDISGRLVETLIAGHQTVGTHNTVWNGINHPTGEYFIMLKTPVNSSIARVILLK